MDELKPSEESGRTHKQDCLFYLDLLSHDLLNYHQAVLGYMEIVLMDKSINESKRKYIIAAIEQLKNSSQLIEDIRKIAQLLGYISASNFREISLKEAVEDSLDELKRQFPDRKISANIMAEAEGARVLGTEAVNDICLNLLSNAVKFDKSEKVEIDVRIARPEDARGMVDLIVEDRGPGIPDDLKKVLLGEVTIEERPPRIRGVGLLMVRAAAKRFGGRLLIGDRITGDHTHGARLVVRLPEVLK